MNLKAISPVIATVIIVSVAIAIAVAVAFWMTGITGLFTRYEKLEIVSAYVAEKTTNHWKIVVKASNKGTSKATIDMVFVNGVPVDESYDEPGANEDGWSVVGSKTLDPGDTVEIHVYLDLNKYSSGQIVEIKLHTASGQEYPKSVQLP